MKFGSFPKKEHELKAVISEYMNYYPATDLLFTYGQGYIWIHCLWKLEFIYLLVK